MANSTNWVWKNSRATNSALLVLLAIAHEADRRGKDGKAVLSVPQIARKTRLGERTVQVALRDLDKLGEVEVWPGRGQHDPSGYAVRGADPAPLRGADYAPRHSARGADPAGGVDSRGADPAPHKPDTSQVRPPRGADSAPLGKTDMFKRSTGIDEVQVKDVVRNDVERLCDHLADRIEANGSKRPVIGKRWRDAARLMLDRDGYSEEQVTAAIDWCQKDEFWRANILSMPKLREKYHTLRLQASRNGTRNGRQADTDALFDRQMARAKERDAREQPGNNGSVPVHQSALPSPGRG